MDELIPVLLWSALAFGLIGLGAALGWWYRRRWVTSAEVDSVPAFTLAELRAMRDRGDLSAAEFERMRSILLGNANDRA